MAKPPRLKLIDFPHTTDESGCPVAVYFGLDLTHAGKKLAFLICLSPPGGAEVPGSPNDAGFFVENARPSDADEDRVECPRCERGPHWIISLDTAIREDLIDVREAIAMVDFQELTALLLGGASGDAQATV